MSLSKDLYDRGYVGKIECKYPLLDQGVRFTIDFGRQKNEKGTWEILSNEDAPLYLCRRVLKSGKLSRSQNLGNHRKFNESCIYRAIKSNI